MHMIPICRPVRLAPDFDAMIRGSTEVKVDTNG